MNQFTKLENVNSEIIESLSRQGFTEMTPVQASTLPESVKGKDVIAQGKTGSGKTVAFAIACLNTIELESFTTQSIILCPTRELAAQVAEQCRLVGKGLANLKVLTLCGGEALGPQIQSLKHSPHVVVGTPGRVLDHLERRRLNLSRVKTRVLDEADRMLDMGFSDDVTAIFSKTPKQVQSLLFSATWTDGVKHLASQFLSDPVSYSPTAVDSVNKDIEQVAYSVEPHTRFNVLKAVLTTFQPQKAMVFCNTRKQVAEVVDDLQNAGFSAAGLQGEMEQHERTAVLAQFAAESLGVLVGTDVAARGLDIKEVDCVVNVDIAEDPDIHTHRIGRTGRAGAKGVAISLVSDNDRIYFERISELFEPGIPLKGGQSLRFHANRIKMPEYGCILVGAGKKQKLRPGDFLGSLTKDGELPGEDIGKIAVQNSQSFVAVKSRSVKPALKFFRDGKIKGKRVRARKLG